MMYQLPTTTWGGFVALCVTQMIDFSASFLYLTRVHRAPPTEESVPLVSINVDRCIQDSQEFGSTDKHMVSRVFYSIDVDGVPKGFFYSNLKQVVGSAYRSDNVEVSPPHGYNGPYNHNTFSNEVAGYFCRSVGSILLLGPGTLVRMRNNTIVVPYRFQFEAEGPAASW